MTNSERFVQAHKNTRKAVQENSSLNYRIQFGLELAELYSKKDMNKIKFEDLKKVKFEGPSTGWVFENGKKLKAFKEDGMSGECYELEGYEGTLEYVYGYGFMIINKERDLSKMITLKSIIETNKNENKTEKKVVKNTHNYKFKEGDKVKFRNKILTIKSTGLVDDDIDYGMMYKSHITFIEDENIFTNELYQSVAINENNKDEIMELV